MKRLMVYTKYERKEIGNFVELLKNNMNYILLSVMFLCGILIGCTLFFIANKNAGGLRNVIDYVFGAQTDMKSIFLFSFITSVILLAICFSGGLSCVGVPLICLLPVAKGLISGIEASYLLTKSGLQGLSGFVTAALPGIVLSTTVLIIACNNGFVMSKNVAACTFLKERNENSLREYIVKNIILLLIALLSSVIDMLLMNILIKG